MAPSALEQFAAAACDPGLGLQDAARLNVPVIRTLGADAPVELIRAAGVMPVRLVADANRPTPRADRIMGQASMGIRGKRLLEQLTNSREAVLITHADAVQPQLFAALRELSRLGEPGPEQVHFLDLLHLRRASSKSYNVKRLNRFSDWLAEIGGRRPSEGDVAQAIAIAARARDLTKELGELRRRVRPKLNGSDMLNIVAAAHVFCPETQIGLMEQLLSSHEELPELSGRRVYLCGTSHEHADFYREIESLPAVVVGEDHEWGERFQTDIPASSEDICAPSIRRVPRTVSPAERAQRIAEDSRKCGADLIIHLSIGDDEAAPWDVAALRRIAEVPIMALSVGADPSAANLCERVREFLGERAEDKPSIGGGETVRRPNAKPAGAPGERSRKSLQSLANFGSYQREWFASVRSDVAAGAPFAVVNANAPQEILRAMGIPFVVNQWWASIVAAKQQSRRYLQLLRAHDYPTKVEAYSSQGLAASFDEKSEEAPWGGLPRPDFVHAVASSDPTLKIFDEWAGVTSAECFIYERTIDPRWEISSQWWEELPDQWDEVLEPERIDLMVDELNSVIERLELATGRSFSSERFESVMDLVNEQEEYFRRTRDLVASSAPAPITIVDSMPATMVPQWHRGTEWGRDAAKAFYEEVLDRVRNGLGAVPNERVRLMWVGRGLWSDMGFYQKWEASHGAVFIWSMYLALAADGYIRKLDGGRDPMRALAARFITMGDELRMPSWAGPWHVHEARTHKVDGAVALRDADPFVVRALREEGIPVLELPVDNFAREGEDASLIETAITRFIEGPAAARAEARRVAT